MVGVKTANPLNDLRNLLKLGTDVSIAVGYIDSFGLRIVEDHLKTLEDTDQKFRILVNLERGCG